MKYQVGRQEMKVEEIKASIPDVMRALRASKDDPEFRKAFTEGFFSEQGFSDFEKMVNLYAVVKVFIEEHKISCPEATIKDSVYEKAPELVEALADIVGYYHDEEDDDDE